MGQMMNHFNILTKAGDKAICLESNRGHWEKGKSKVATVESWPGGLEKNK